MNHFSTSELGILSWNFVKLNHRLSDLGLTCGRDRGLCPMHEPIRFLHGQTGYLLLTRKLSNCPWSQKHQVQSHIRNFMVNGARSAVLSGTPWPRCIRSNMWR
jgi:hypothetical protein